MTTATTIQQIREMGQGREIFIRYTRSIKHDRGSGYVSRNHQTGQTEAGLSVNHIPTDAPDDALLNALTEYRLYLLDPDMTAYICTGTFCGRGSDGEPLIVNVQPLAYVDKDLLAMPVEEIEALRLARRIAEETERLTRITDRIAIQQTEELRAVYQTQLDALKSGRRWYDDVERMERKPRFF